MNATAAVADTSGRMHRFLLGIAVALVLAWALGGTAAAKDPPITEKGSETAADLRESPADAAAASPEGGGEASELDGSTVASEPSASAPAVAAPEATDASTESSVPATTADALVPVPDGPVDELASPDGTVVPSVAEPIAPDPAPAVDELATSDGVVVPGIAEPIAPDPAPADPAAGVVVAPAAPSAAEPIVPAAAPAVPSPAEATTPIEPVVTEEAAPSARPDPAAAPARRSPPMSASARGESAGASIVTLTAAPLKAALSAEEPSRPKLPALPSRLPSGVVAAINRQAARAPRKFEAVSPTIVAARDFAPDLTPRGSEGPSGSTSPLGISPRRGLLLLGGFAALVGLLCLAAPRPGRRVAPAAVALRPVAFVRPLERPG